MILRAKIIRYCDQAIFICLCLLIFCLPFAKAAVETFTWMAMFFWLSKRILGYRTESFFGLFPVTDINKALAVMVIANAVSIIFSAYPGLSFRGFFGKELKFLAIFFMLVESISSKQRLKGVLITIIASALLITVDAAVQVYTGKDFLRGYPYDTFSASFYAATGFASWLTVVIPVLVGIAMSKILPDRRLKYLLFATAFVQFLYLIKTLSRGAWIGFAIASFFMGYYIFRELNFKKRVLCLSSVAVFLAVVLFMPRPLMFKIKDAIRVKLNLSQTISQRMSSIAQINKGSVSERIYWWQEAIRIIKDYPLFGCGINTYSRVALKYKSFEYGGGYPHNSYLQKAAEIGLPGLLAFLWLLFLYFKTGFLYLKSNKDYLVLGILSGILAFLVHAFFDTHFYSLQLVILFWYMLGLTIAAIKLDPQS